MDLYITDSMQDMLDIDIRSEVATVVGGVNEFSSLMAYELPSLDFDTNSNDCDNVSWLNGANKWSSNDIYADVGACVNPNSVMPVVQTSAMLSTTSLSAISLLKSPKPHLNLNQFNQSNITSPKEKKSHLTFSPNPIKVPVVQESNKKLLINTATSQASRMNGIENVKKDLSVDMKISTINGASITNKNHSNVVNIGGNTIKIGPGIGGITFSNHLQFSKLKQNNLKSNNLFTTAVHHNNNNSNNKRDSSPHSNNHHNHHQQQHHNSNHLLQNHQHQNTNKNFTSRNIIINNNNNNSNNKIGLSSNNSILSVNSPNYHHIVNSNSHNNKQKVLNANGHEFPKPAYSYSCLIAMALKNSRSGSLPVSEIYSFMCEHFPYFKTAPNGWKNSVRHNLSLNKCFEKIEKPATNGGQRKGCLWAMNPTKIIKMDEEVQKWSRKDPSAIRRAMVFPEHLEALERGEMKHGHSGESDGENEVVSDTEQSDSEQDNENEVEESFIMNTPESLIDEEREPEPDVDFDIEVCPIYSFF